MCNAVLYVHACNACQRRECLQVYNACLVIHMWVRPICPPGMQHLPCFCQGLLSFIHHQAQRASCLLDCLPLNEAVLALELSMGITAEQKDFGYLAAL